MSTEITEAHVRQYGSNVYFLAQQKGSRLRGFVRQESQKGKQQHFDRIGVVSAIRRTVRHGDTPRVDVPHSRRMVTLSDYEWADLIDDQDKIRTLIDPTNPYVQSGMWAMGRALDDELIAAATGTAYAGEDGDTAVTFPTSQRLHAVSGGALVNMNVGALRRAKQMLDAADIDPSIPRHLAITSSQLYSMLGQTEVTSSDYNSIKALVQGELDTFLGFKIHRLERLLTDPDALAFNTTTGLYDAGGTAGTGARMCLAWAQDGLISSIGMDMQSKVSERGDKSYSTQVYCRMSVGAVRMEEEKVVAIHCKET